jgi:hypothetical protein
MVERTKEERERERLGLDGLEERERLGLDRSGERKAWAWTGRAWKAGAGVYKQSKRKGSVGRSVSQSESVSRVTMMRAMVISVERERERESPRVGSMLRVKKQRIKGSDERDGDDCKKRCNWCNRWWVEWD